MSLEMDQFKDLFLQTAREHLQLMQDILLKIESNPNDLSLMEELMRTGHSLKGESGAMGFEQIATLGHVIEDLFTAIGNGSMKMQKELADALFEAFDQISASLDAIAAGSTELSCKEYVDRIKAITGLTTDGFGKSGEAPQPAAAPVVEAPVVETPVVETPVVAEVAPVVPVPASEVPVAPAVVEVAVPASVLVAPVVPAPTMPEVVVPAVVAPAPVPTPVVAATPPTNSAFAPMPMSLDDVPMPKPQVGGQIAGNANTVIGSTADAAAAASEVLASNKEVTTPDAPAKPAAATSEQISTVTLKVERLDQMIGISEELVLLKMRLKTSSQVQADVALKAEIHRLDRLVTDLQFYVMQARLFPISMALHTIPRLVRDVAHKTNKKVRLEMEGEDTTVDRTIIDHLTEPFVHLVRNAIDHGIELPELRKAIGKAEEAVLTMRSYTKDNKFYVEIRDDGQGIEWEKLGHAAVKKGVLTAAELHEILQGNQHEKLLFLDGVSTSEEVTDISGRGVGMSAVRSSIKKLGGDITVETEVGKGTAFIIRLPMTLAIMQALLAGVGKQVFALPANEIVRTVQLRQSDLRSSVGTNVVAIDGQEVFLFDLDTMFGGIGGVKEDNSLVTVVLVRRGEEMIGCVVDKIISEEEILVKPLGPLLKRSTHFSGATILADGNAAPIINFDGLTWK